DVDDDVPLAPIKRSMKHYIKINARNRLFRVFDEEEDKDEGENKKSWEFDDEVANEDEIDEENEHGIATRFVKKGRAPVILLRNTGLQRGLCNGTRLIITQITHEVLEAQIITGSHIGEKVFIGRIDMTPTDSSWPFRFIRRQFPIKTAYNPTTNRILSLDLILLDERRSSIHAKIPFKLINKFKDRVKEGCVYKIHNFTVIDYDRIIFRPLDRKCFVEFCFTTNTDPSRIQPELFDRYVFAFVRFGGPTDHVIGVLRKWGPLQDRVGRNQVALSEDIENDASVEDAKVENYHVDESEVDEVVVSKPQVDEVHVDDA
nr:replication protein A 70 kDa DNA-binding subunit B [Tanacetum cinerariifolium]